MTSSHSLQHLRYCAGTLTPTPDEVAAEEPLEIRVEGQSVAVVMRTPGHDRELAAGFLLTEGLVSTRREIFDITACVATTPEARGNVIDVGLTNPAALDLARLTRHVFTSSSCGVCSKSSLELVMRQRPPLPRGELIVTYPLLLSLPERLAAAQETFQRTGGLHACALFTPGGELLAAREDVGRHNALDKLLGWALLENRLLLAECILFLSGRVSFEMMQKAHAGGVPVVAAISAPTSLAVQFAEASGQTLAGFVRTGSLNLYAGAERVGLG